MYIGFEVLLKYFLYTVSVVLFFLFFFCNFSVSHMQILDNTSGFEKQPKTRINLLKQNFL